MTTKLIQAAVITVCLYLLMVISSQQARPLPEALSSWHSAHQASGDRWWTTETAEHWQDNGP
ncbi:MAG TPA: hypothetical protein V6C78_23620 [Crinalium sp.]